MFPLDGHEDAASGHISLTAAPTWETALFKISGTISGAPAPQTAPPGYTPHQQSIDGDLSILVTLSKSGSPNITMSFDCSGYTVTDDSSPPKSYIASHLYLDSSTIPSGGIALAMGPV